jgi:hypothetical protein
MLIKHLVGGGAQGIKVWELPPFRPNYTDFRLSYDSRGLSEGGAVQICMHLRSLIVLHFGTVEATGLKIMA